MVQVSYPGVYVVEVPSGVRPIVGVATSIGAFFGRTEKGPINRAVRVTDRATFIRVFSGPHPDSDLAASVEQFFNNGGTDCYVVRVAHNPATADLVLRSLGNVSVLRAQARDAGLWGNNIRLEVDYNTANADDTFNLRVLVVAGDQVATTEEHTALSMNPDSARFASDFVTQSSQVIRLELAPGFAPLAAAVNPGFSESRRPITTNPGGGQSFADLVNAIVFPNGPAPAPSRGRFELSINDGPFVAVNLATGGVYAGGQAAIATEIRNRIRAALPAGLDVDVAWPVVHDTFRVLRITAANPATPPASIRIRRSNVEDIAGPLMLGIDQGGVEVTRFSEIRPAPTATFLNGDLNVLAALTQNAFDRMTISGTEIAPPLVVDLVEGGVPLLQTTAAGDRWYRDAVATSVSGNNDGVREKLFIIARAINRALPPPDGIRRVRAEVWGSRLALIPAAGNHNATITVATSLAAGGGTDIGTAAAAPNNLFTANTRRYALGLAGASPFQAGVGTNGLDDDGNPPDFNDYVGNALTGTGFHALDTADLVNLMLLPRDRALTDAQMLQLYGPASIYCSERRAFLLIDAPADWTDPNTLRLDADVNDVNQLRSLVVRQNTAVYYPRVVYSDRGRRRLMGATGAVAGVMARIDSTRGVWKAPAGVEADVRGILDLEVNLTDREQGILNKAGANALRIFPSGFVVWGARTLAGTDDDPSEWKYVPVRRFALFLEESLYRGTKWIVFEPNDEPLWANIRKNLRAFMMGLFRQGAFQGSTPDLAFYVKCDAETTTATDRLLGIVNIEVGFAPLKPAEFVVIYIQQIAEQTE